MLAACRGVGVGAGEWQVDSLQVTSPPGRAGSSLLPLTFATDLVWQAGVSVVSAGQRLPEGPVYKWEFSKVSPAVLTSVPFLVKGPEGDSIVKVPRRKRSSHGRTVLWFQSTLLGVTLDESGPSLLLDSGLEGRWAQLHVFTNMRGTGHGRTVSEGSLGWSEHRLHSGEDVLPVGSWPRPACGASWNQVLPLRWGVRSTQGHCAREQCLLVVVTTQLLNFTCTMSHRLFRD